MTRPPDLLLTDVVMPGMSGLDLAEVVRAKLPSLKVLLVTGYADHECLARIEGGGFELLRKPLSPEALSRRVEEALAGPTAKGTAA
jgi:CheY-like chemotaxis protein